MLTARHDLDANSTEETSNAPAPPSQSDQVWHALRTLLSRHTGHRGGSGGAVSLEESEPFIHPAEESQDIEAQIEVTGEETDEPQAIQAAENPQPTFEIEEALPSLRRWSQQFVPLLLLFLMAFLSHHFIGVFVFLWLTLVLHRANKAIREQVLLWEECRLQTLAHAVLVLALNITAVYSTFGSSKLGRRLLLLPTTAEQFSFWAGVWTVTTSDLMVKHMSAIGKCSLLGLLKGKEMPKYRRRQVFSLNEAAVQVYRTALPVPVWTHWLQHSQGITIVSMAITLAYLTLKSVFMWERIKCFVAEVKTMVNGSLAYGTILEPGSQQGEDECPICQSELERPVALHCGHTYCESCISMWMDRETTCPLCREVVRDVNTDDHLTDGSTTLLPQIF